MIDINHHYLKLKARYLFRDIASRVKAFHQANPDAPIIRLGIGDVTRPLAPAVIEAFHRGVDDMARAESFRGYGPEQGYPFLLEAIIENDYKARGIDLEQDEVFVSDGSKSDTGNIQDIFSLDNVVAVMDPVYPVYVDTNVMAGRSGPADEKGQYEGMVYMPCTPENHFTPALPEQSVDMIYLCYPNNPTGAVADREALARWVAYAREHKAVILYDAAYEAFITEQDIPHSIYEIDGAKDVAIEFRSFSKSAGFTGTRCAWTVVPKALKAHVAPEHHPEGRDEMVPVNPLWNRRHSTRFNGVSYPVQRAAAATYSTDGKAQVGESVDYYMENARLIRTKMAEFGYSVYGGVNAPYIWLKTPENMGSWEFFDNLLNKAHVVGTPGAGFGNAGEGFFRLSAFGSRENVEQAMDRIKAM